MYTKKRIIVNYYGDYNPKYGDYVKDKTNDYYYSAYVELNDNNINDFELLGNLNDYETTKNPEYYDEENVLTHVRLYWEHAYPRFSKKRCGYQHKK